jgi:hypothetical protein
MSISVSQRSSATPANPARQQLDELDALLQRMLELPVNNLDGLDADRAAVPPQVSYTTADEPEAPPAEAPPPKIDFQALKQRLEARPEAVESPTPPADATPEVSAPTAPEAGDNWVPLSSTWQPSSLTWKPLAQSWKPPSGDAPLAEAAAPVPEPPAKEVPVWEPAPAAEAVPSLAHAFRAKTEEQKAPPALHAPVARWEVPLVWFNAAFDLCLKPLGRVGDALRLPVGRFTLAVLGMGCLVAAAVVLFIDWYGWPS